MKRKFPMLGFFLLIVGIIWLLQGLGIIAISVPWIPVMLIIIATGIIFNRFFGK